MTLWWIEMNGKIITLHSEEDRTVCIKIYWEPFNSNWDFLLKSRNVNDRMGFTKVIKLHHLGATVSVDLEVFHRINEKLTCLSQLEWICKVWSMYSLWKATHLIVVEIQYLRLDQSHRQTNRRTNRLISASQLNERFWLVCYM